MTEIILLKMNNNNGKVGTELLYKLEIIILRASFKFRKPIFNYLTTCGHK